jgi:hypothetical protein
MAAKKTKITKEQFDTACNKYPPNKWITFAYRYFSKNTAKSDLALKNTIVYILVGLFGVGFFSTIFGAPKRVIIFSTITYSVILALLVLYLFSAAMLNFLRLSKICEELGITRLEYDELVKKYYE